MIASRSVTDPNLMILTSREAILDLAPVLQNLAERTGQPGAMHWLSYFVEKGLAAGRVPHLVLVLRPENHQGSSLCAEDLQGAALFFEYRILGRSTGVYSTGDAGGFDRVIALAADRTRIAAIALRALVQRGAHLVLATYEGYKAAEPADALAGLPGLQAAARQRHVERSMKLGSTMDATLASLGKHTRSNLRYYRRRLEKIMPLTFVPDAVAALAGADLQKMNAASLNPVPSEEFVRRVRGASTLPGSYLCGLRGPDGQWLSLAGGWRGGGQTVLHWQVNAAGFEQYSISTVMRNFLLEAEIAGGAERLMIYGGTQHSMRHAFTQQPVADLIVQRQCWQMVALRCAAHLFAMPNGLLGRSNFLARTLLDENLHWVPGKSNKQVDFVDALKARHFGTTA